MDRPVRQIRFLKNRLIEIAPDEKKHFRKGEIATLPFMKAQYQIASGAAEAVEDGE